MSDEVDFADTHSVQPHMYFLYKILKPSIRKLFSDLSYEQLYPELLPPLTESDDVFSDSQIQTLNPNKIYTQMWPKKSLQEPPPALADLVDVHCHDEIPGFAFTRVGDDGFNICVSIVWPNKITDFTSVPMTFFFRVIKDDDGDPIDDYFIYNRLHRRQIFKEIFPVDILFRHPDLVHNAIIGELATLCAKSLRDFPAIESFMAEPIPERYPHYVALTDYRTLDNMSREQIEKWWYNIMVSIRIEDRRSEFDYITFYEKCLQGEEAASAYWREFASPLWPCNDLEVQNSGDRKKNSFQQTLNMLKGNGYSRHEQRANLAVYRFYEWSDYHEQVSLRTSEAQAHYKYRIYPQDFLDEYCEFYWQHKIQQDKQLQLKTKTEKVKKEEHGRDLFWAYSVRQTRGNLITKSEGSEAGECCAKVSTRGRRGGGVATRGRRGGGVATRGRPRLVLAKSNRFDDLPPCDLIQDNDNLHPVMETLFGVVADDSCVISGESRVTQPMVTSTTDKKPILIVDDVVATAAASLDTEKEISDDVVAAALAAYLPDDEGN